MQLTKELDAADDPLGLVRQINGRAARMVPPPDCICSWGNELECEAHHGGVEPFPPLQLMQQSYGPGWRRRHNRYWTPGSDAELAVLTDFVENGSPWAPTDDEKDQVLAEFLDSYDEGTA